jgi:uncharacterized protein YkwD
MKFRCFLLAVISISLSSCVLPFGKYTYIAAATSVPDLSSSTPTNFPSLNKNTQIPSIPPSPWPASTETETQIPFLFPTLSHTVSPLPSRSPAALTTSTISPTLLRTNTQTGTFIRTLPSTSTRTFTPPPSVTNTRSVSPGLPSFTFTASATRTATKTPTPSFTPTVTTQTVSPPPPTVTYTRTSTKSSTYTRTTSRTSTATGQLLFTFTNTVTALPPSATPTWTYTPIPPTATFTRTPSNTITSTLPLPSAPPPTTTQTRAPTTVPPTATTFTCSPVFNSSFESQVIALINKERANAGVGLLSGQGQLGNAARSHSQDMACNGFFSHTGSDGSSPSMRISREGYSWSAIAENIAAGYGDPASMVTGWMGSQGHKDNILNPNYTEVGIGYVYVAGSPYGAYWTANFAHP